MGDKRRPRWPFTERFKRWQRILLVALVTVGTLLGGLTVVLVLDDSSDHRVSTLGASDQSLSTDRLKAMLLPVSAADINSEAVVLGNFSARVNNAAFSRCFVSKGYAPLPETPGLPPGSPFGGFPDPDSLRRYGFDGPTGPINAPLNPQPYVPAEASNACTPGARKAVALLEALTTPVMSGWNAELAAADNTPAVQAAWTAWVGCMTKAGYHITSQDDFLSQVDRARQAASTPDAERSVSLRLATDYANCLDQGVIQAQTKARTVARDAHVAAHLTEFTAAQQQLPGVIESLSKQYGISSDGLLAGKPSNASQGGVPTTTTSAGMESAAAPRDIQVFQAGVCHDINGVRVPCEGPHHSEDFATFSINGTLDSNASAERILAACASLFSSYTGLPVQEARGPRYSVMYAAGSRVSDSSILDATCAILQSSNGTSSATGSARRANA